MTPFSDSSQQPWSFIVPSRSVILRRSCVLLKCSSSPTPALPPPALALVCVNVSETRKKFQGRCFKVDLFNPLVGGSLNYPLKKVTSHAELPGVGDFWAKDLAI